MSGVRKIVVGTFACVVSVGAGLLCALCLALLLLLSLNFFSCLLIVAAIMGFPFLVKALLVQRAKVEAVAFVVGFLVSLPPMLLAGGILANFDVTPRDSRFYAPQLYDSCSELKMLFSCGISGDPFSRALVALRCWDITAMTEPVQKLNPGYYDLSQQCFGG